MFVLSFLRNHTLSKQIDLITVRDGVDCIVEALRFFSGAR
jgi:hypothetical protein